MDSRVEEPGGCSFMTLPNHFLCWKLTEIPGSLFFYIIYFFIILTGDAQKQTWGPLFATFVCDPTAFSPVDKERKKPS